MLEALMLIGVWVFSISTKDLPLSGFVYLGGTNSPDLT